jgi:hypothetical protein
MLLLNFNKRRLEYDFIRAHPMLAEEILIILGKERQFSSYRYVSRIELKSSSLKWKTCKCNFCEIYTFQFP